jgi:broad specificity phosphatase PhoE
VNELWAVRHGKTEWSVAGKHTSTTDLPLLPEGESVARGLQGRLADVDFAQVLTSPRLRARRTAELAGFPDAETDEDLAEWDYGDYEGLTTPEIREQRPDWSLWTDDAPNGETAAEVAARADRVIERALAAEGDVALFAHGHILRVVGARWIGVGADGGGSLGLDTASVGELGFERERHVIWLWNDTSHLRGS